MLGGNYWSGRQARLGELPSSRLDPRVEFMNIG